MGSGRPRCHGTVTAAHSACREMLRTSGGLVTKIEWYDYAFYKVTAPALKVGMHLLRQTKGRHADPSLSARLL